MVYQKESLPMKDLIQEAYIACRYIIIFSCLLGLAYPLIITLIAQLTTPTTASGSLIEQNGKIIGSKLIGQMFSAEHYFQSRPSAHHYDGMASGASNLGPSSKKLRQTTLERILLNRIINQIPPIFALPADMVLSSASGLDPHISVENALLQLPRVARVRHLDEITIKELILQNIEYPLAGFWGETRINVLMLNIALDTVSRQQAATSQSSNP